jgi:hypothetical protein
MYSILTTAVRIAILRAVGYLPSLFHDHSLRYVELESEFTKHGPFSRNSPSIELLPGPPFIQIDSGAFSGSFLDSKNQKNVLISYVWFCTPRSAKASAGRWT